MSNNNNYTTNYYNEQFSTVQVAELARTVLQPYTAGRKELKNHYHCPSCGGKLYITANNEKLYCVSNWCKGIYKEIKKLSGQWVDYEGLKKEREEERARKQYEWDLEKKSLAKEQAKLELVPGQGLIEKDFDEFAKSAISPELASLNFARLTDRGEIAQYLGWPRYSHVPGWVSLGVGFDGKPSYKGQFKPDKKINLDGDKPAKYLTCKSGYDALLPSIPGINWNQVVADPSIPVMITEGMKKALSLWSLGHLCVAIPGVTMWDVANIHRLAAPGRPIGLAYDSDWRKNEKVLAQLLALGQWLENRGCLVNIVVWDSRYKGVDDFIAKSDDLSSFNQLPFSEWKETIDKTIFTNDGKDILIDNSAPELIYSGTTVTLTDRYDIPGAIHCPTFCDKEGILNRVHSYRNMGCRRFSNLSVDELKKIARDYNISLHLTTEEMLDRLEDKINREEYAGATLREARKLCRTHNIPYEMNKADIASRLEQSGINKDAINWGEKADKVTISIKVDHPSALFIANIINAVNPYHGDNLFDVYLPFELLGQGQWLIFNKVMRNDPAHMAKNALFAEYLRMKSFTPDVTTHTRFLGGHHVYQSIDLNQPKIYCVKSGLGTGKTFLMVDLLKKVIADNPSSHIMLVGYRNGLIANTINELKENGINMIPGNEFKKNPMVKKGERAIVGFCIDSLLEVVDRMHKEWEQNTIFVFDEFDGVTTHALVGSTVKERRYDILNMWNDVLNATKKGIICLSGTLNDTVLKVFSDINKEQVKIENHTDRPAIPLDFVLGTSDVSPGKILEIKEKDNMAMIDQFVARLQVGENIIVSSDAQKTCEKLHEYVNDYFEGRIKILRIDGKSRSKEVSKPIVDAILANPKLLMEMGYQLLIYNSSAESGVNIDFKDVPYFSHQYHFGYAIVSVDATIQMLRRYRGSCPVTFWTTPQALSKMNILSQDDYKFSLMCKSLESGHNWEDQSDKFLKLAEDLDFISRFEKKYPRQCLIYALNQHGYTVNYITNDESDTSLAEQTERIEVRYANEIFSADDKYIGENLYEIRVEDDTSWEDQMALKKAHYFANFNYSRQDLLEETAELFNPENIREIEYRNRHFFDHCRNFVYVEQNKETLQLLQRNTYKEKVFFGDIKLLVLPIEAIQKSGLLELMGRNDGQFKKELQPDDPIFTTIRKYATSHPRCWFELANDSYSERMFFSQISSILDRYFGVKFLRKKTKCVINFPQLELSAVPKIREHILEKIEKIKAYQEDLQNREIAQDYEFGDYRSDVTPEMPIEESLVIESDDSSCIIEAKTEPKRLDNLLIDKQLDLVGKQVFSPNVIVIDRDTVITYQGKLYRYLEKQFDSKLVFVNSSDASDRIVVDNSNGFARKFRTMSYSF